MSSTFGQRLKGLRTSKGLSQKALAECLKVSKSSINMYEHDLRQPNLEMFDLIADFFNCDVSYLLGKSDIINMTQYNGLMFQQSEISNVFPIEIKKIPFLGEIACGEPVYADEERESYIAAGIDVKADFCLRAKGDSMIGARILDGDIVFIRRQDIVENGEIAAVIIGDEATLKRVYYYPEKNLLILKAENPAYKDFVYTDEQLDTIRILGKAVAFQSDVN